MKSYIKQIIGVPAAGRFRVLPLILAAIVLCAPIMCAPVMAQDVAQDVDASRPERGHITGTVTDVNNDTVPAATVVLEGSVLKDPRTVVSDDNGSFKFDDVDAGTYTITITATGVGHCTSPEVTVAPGQYVILNGSKLKIAEALTTVSVTYSPEKAATEQVKREEQQRVFGFVPNFYVVYDRDLEPLSSMLTFQLALGTSIIP